MDRREFLKTAGAIALGAAAAPGALAGRDAPRNVLVFMSDEHNPRYSSVYPCPGYPGFVHTPNMSALAARGVVFENCYCPSPLCMPSRSAFASGLRDHQTQVYNNCSVFQDRYNASETPGWSMPTYGSVLKAAGVHTCYVGKLDIYAHSSRAGFSEMIRPGDRKPPGDTNIGRNPLAIRRGSRGVATQYGPKEDVRAWDQQIVTSALDWIGSSGRRLNEQGKSWTLTVNIGSPHFPHYCETPDWELYPDPDLPPHGRDCESARHQFAVDHRTHFEDDDPAWSEANVRGNRRGYYGKITYVDRALGQLTDALHTAGLARNTVVAYTSDHGEMLGKFGMWRKCHLYEDSARVPLIVAGPGFGGGKRVSTPVDLMDLQATMFQSLGVSSIRPRHWVGSALQGVSADDPERVVFSEYHGHSKRASHFMIRKGDWKLLHYIGAPHQLFDLAEDPNELTNLADRHQDKLRELQGHLREVCDPEAENRRAERFIRAQLAAFQRNYGGVGGDS